MCKSRSRPPCTRPAFCAMRACQSRSSSRRWEIRGIPARAHVSSTNGSRQASSGRCMKCTSGPTGRSSTGRKGCRGPPACAPSEAPGDFGNPWTYRHVQDVLAAAMGGGGAPPAGLDWDLYLGPIAQNIPYHPIYHPFNWRGWLDFGSGALGDMGAHLIDHPFSALGLTHPSSIEATSDPMGQHAPGRAGVVSGIDLRALPIRRARHAAAREAILVRRGNLSAAPGHPAG